MVLKIIGDCISYNLTFNRKSKEFSQKKKNYKIIKKSALNGMKDRVEDNPYFWII
jgi:hypothetical protein